MAEAAVAYKCKAMGDTPRGKTFRDRIEWLVRRGVIPEREKGKWDAIRGMRNIESHPEQQMLDTPGAVIGILMRIAG